MLINILIETGKEDDEGPVLDIRCRIRPAAVAILLADLKNATATPRKVRDESVAVPLLTEIQKALAKS